VTKAILQEAALRLKGERPAPAYLRMVEGKRASGRLGDAPNGPEADEY
jgi:hypothetical protein